SEDWSDWTEWAINAVSELYNDNSWDQTWDEGILADQEATPQEGATSTGTVASYHPLVSPILLEDQTAIATTAAGMGVDINTQGTVEQWLQQTIRNRQDVMEMISVFHRRVTRPEMMGMVAQLETALKRVNDSVFACHQELIFMVSENRASQRHAAGLMLITTGGLRPEAQTYMLGWMLAQVPEVVTYLTNRGLLSSPLDHTAQEALPSAFWYNALQADPVTVPQGEMWSSMTRKPLPSPLAGDLGKGPKSSSPALPGVPGSVPTRVEGTASRDAAGAMKRAACRRAYRKWRREFAQTRGGVLGPCTYGRGRQVRDLRPAADGVFLLSVQGFSGRGSHDLDVGMGKHVGSPACAEFKLRASSTGAADAIGGILVSVELRDSTSPCADGNCGVSRRGAVLRYRSATECRTKKVADRCELAINDKGAGIRQQGVASPVRQLRSQPREKAVCQPGRPVRKVKPTVERRARGWFASWEGGAQPAREEASNLLHTEQEAAAEEHYDMWAGRRPVQRLEVAEQAVLQKRNIVVSQATPRERQFGIYEPPIRRSSTNRSSRAEPVELPLSQLHIVAAQRQLPSLLEAQPQADASACVAAWSELLRLCQRRAPELLATWSCGVGALLRFAVLIPREQWLRDPADWETEEPKGDGGEVDMADIDGPEGPMTGLEALPRLESLLRHLMTKYDDAPMTLAGAFTWSDGAGGTLRERPGREVVLCSGAGIQLCTRFALLFAEVCRGDRKPVAAAQELLTPNLSKKMVSRLLQSSDAKLPPPPPVQVPESVRHVQPLSVILASPLLALRRAQMETLGGPAILAEALARTQLGKDLGSEEEEEFALSILSWACRFAEEEELQDPSKAAQAVEWLLAQRMLDPKFSLVVAGNPRAPKKVLEAARRDAATLELQRLQMSGQRFLPNPGKIRGFVKKGVLAAFGSPYSEDSPDGKVLPQGLRAMLGMEGTNFREPEPPNSWHGDTYEPCAAEQSFLQDPKFLRKATVRIDEILSFEYLQHVGQTMKNCLRAERRGGMSLMKYLSRVKARESSFWVMTITAESTEEEEEAPLQHMLLMEVYNGLNVIHQAEGPHPRRWPRADAWTWLQEWAAQEGLRPDGPEGVTVGPYGAYEGSMDKWDIRRCFLW
ncbi:unnamed protein product, partial [Symbiodinium sp. KB8]